MSFLPNCNIKIYKLPDTTNPVWIGTTDEYGKATNINGAPSLRYGNYKVTSEHCDYDIQNIFNINDGTIEVDTFTIPGASEINMTIGCTSSITTHETNYDHSKLSSINNNILKDVIPAYAGFHQFPLPVNELTDDDFSDFTTYGQISSNISYTVYTASVTFDFVTSRYISTIPYILKYQLWATYYAGSAAYARIRIQVYNGAWIDFYAQTIYPPCTSGGPCTTNTGVVSISNVIPYYSNLSQIRILMEESAQADGQYLNNAGVNLYGTKILAFG